MVFTTFLFCIQKPGIGFRREFVVDSLDHAGRQHTSIAASQSSPHPPHELLIGRKTKPGKFIRTKLVNYHWYKCLRCQPRHVTHLDDTILSFKLCAVQAQLSTVFCLHKHLHAEGVFGSHALVPVPALHTSWDSEYRAGLWNWGACDKWKYIKIYFGVFK